MSLHSKKAVIDNGRPKQLSSVVAKINIEVWNIDSDNTNNTESSYGLSGLTMKVIVLIKIFIIPEAASRRYYFFKQLYKKLS